MARICVKRLHGWVAKTGQPIWGARHLPPDIYTAHIGFSRNLYAFFISFEIWTEIALHGANAFAIKHPQNGFQIMAPF